MREKDRERERAIESVSVRARVSERERAREKEKPDEVAEYSACPLGSSMSSLSSSAAFGNLRRRERE